MIKVVMGVIMVMVLVSRAFVIRSISSNVRA